MSKITYRRAEPDDVGAIARVNVRSWQDSFAGIVEQGWLDQMSVEARSRTYRRRMEAEGFYEMFVAEGGDEIIGICDVGLPRGAEDWGCEVELYSIYVDKSFQRQSIGRNLLRLVLEHSVSTGRNSMFLDALDVNPYRGFYEQLCGELVGRGSMTTLNETHQTVIYKWSDLGRTLRAMRAAEL